MLTTVLRWVWHLCNLLAIVITQDLIPFPSPPPPLPPGGSSGNMGIVYMCIGVQSCQDIWILFSSLLLQIITPFRVLNVCADSRKEMEEWIGCLKAISSKSNSVSQVSKSGKICSRIDRLEMIFEQNLVKPCGCHCSFSRKSYYVGRSVEPCKGSTLRPIQLQMQPTEKLLWLKWPWQLQNSGWPLFKHHLQTGNATKFFPQFWALKWPAV